MTKKILHLQVPFEQNSSRPDMLSISPDTLGKFMKLCQDKIGQDWSVIASPCIPSVSEDGQTFFNFKLEQLTKEELFGLLG